MSVNDILINKIQTFRQNSSKINLLQHMRNECPQKKDNDINFAKCSKGNPATIVCSSQECSLKAFVCNDNKCYCRGSHKLCFQISIQSIMKIVQAHSFTLKSLAKQIESLFDNAIDKLSDQRDKILNQIKQSAKYRYLGLSQLEKKFVDVVKEGVKDDEINCKLIDKLYKQYKGEKRVNKAFNKGQNLIQKIKLNLKQQSFDYGNNLRQLLQKINRQQQFKDIFQKSKIIKNGQDQDKLLAFFTEKKVRSANLLYTASQNEFSTIKWYEKCQNIPNTLTILETEFGKVIGGFTQFKWLRNNKWIQGEIGRKNHFLFSLTNNDIFTITQNPNYGIYGYTDSIKGPEFGGGHDLHIQDKANQNNNSYANIGYTYTNKKYVNGNMDSQNNFSGAKKFKTKQWQVWQVQFHA